MKNRIFAFFITIAMFQSGLYAQPALDVKVQKMPANNEGNYYDNSYMNSYSEPGNVNVQYQQPNMQQGSQYQKAPRQNDANSYDMRSSTVAVQKPTGPVERTLSIIKPDAVQTNHVGDIISRFEQSGLRVAAIKIVQLDKKNASKFYEVHRDRPFYNDLVDFMSSGPVVVMVLEGPNAIAKNRQMMGATDPAKAAPGTIRADYAQSVTRNAVHGSDSPTAAPEEISFFFDKDAIISRY